MKLHTFRFSVSIYNPYEDDDRTEIIEVKAYLFRSAWRKVMPLALNLCGKYDTISCIILQDFFE